MRKVTFVATELFYYMQLPLGKYKVSWEMVGLCTVALDICVNFNAIALV